jgi:UDP-glucose:glycoprotein glucosyltransferase
LLTILTDPERYPRESLSPEAAYQYTLQSAISNGLLSAPGAQQAVELDLALRASVPKIKAFYQYHTDLSNSTAVDDKSYVDWYGTRIEDVETLVQLLTHDTIEGTTANEKQTEDAFVRPKLLPFDHVYPEPAYTLIRPPRTAIFYGALDSPNFWELHSWLVENAGSYFEYVFRHIPSIHHDSTSFNYLTGYGVSLDLKKMDYLVLDDRFEGSRSTLSVIKEIFLVLITFLGTSNSGSSASSGTTDPIIELLEQYPLNSTIDFKAPLSEEELLGIHLSHNISLLYIVLKNAMKIFRDRHSGLQARERLIGSAQDDKDTLSELPSLRAARSTPRSSRTRVSV